jgi:serine carboxypeptidase-like clade 2
MLRLCEFNITNCRLLLGIAGPGCSSLAYGFAEEFGPYRILPDASGVYLHDNAWNKESNMLFLESPSGVGFSFSKNYSENQEGGDKRTAEDNYLFLLNWFERFPEFKDRDFYIAGESYAGHYVPQLAKLIVDSNPEAKLKINLKGILAGNPVTDAYWDNVGNIDYWHSHALLSDQTWEKMKTACNFSDPNCCSSACDELYTYAETTELGAIDPYSIYTNNCVDLIGFSSVRRKAPLTVRPKNPFMRASRGYDPCIGSYAEAYFNRPEVQRAIHANVSGIIPYNWTGCSMVLQNWTDSDFSVIPVYKALIKARLKILVFSGDADAVVPVTSTRYALAAMKLPIKKPWQAWYHHLQVGGRVLEYEGLTFVTIRGAGHEVPLLQAGRAFHMFKSFLAAKSLPKAPYE